MFSTTVPFLTDGTHDLAGGGSFGVFRPDQFSVGAEFEDRHAFEFGGTGLEFAQDNPALSVARNIKSFARFGDLHAAAIVGDNGIHMSGIYPGTKCLQIRFALRGDGRARCKMKGRDEGSRGVPSEGKSAESSKL
jgi:hypothetical protein